MVYLIIYADLCVLLLFAIEYSKDSLFQNRKKLFTVIEIAAVCVMFFFFGFLRGKLEISERTGSLILAVVAIVLFAVEAVFHCIRKHKNK